MPLDAATHLASQGWGGAGKPLRAGPNALARPIVGVQKKTLGGVGKDRDDAFAFWDQLSYLAQSIKIKLHNDSDTEEEPSTRASSSPPPPQIDRTSTGLISNRRPTGSQTPTISTSTSGTSTPVTPGPPPSGPRVSLMAEAKKQAARLELYRRFYVGPVIGPDHDMSESSSPSSNEDGSPSLSPSSEAEDPSTSTSGPSSSIVVDEVDAEAETRAARVAKKAAREAKRQRKEEKKRRKAERAASKERDLKKAKEKQKHREDDVQPTASCTAPESENTGKKRKRDEDGEEAGASTDTKGRPVSPGRKKKRVKLIMSDPPPPVKYAPSPNPCEKKGILRAPTSDPASTKEQSGSDGEKGKRVTFTKTVISHTVERWWEEAGWSDDGI
ncbi:hypothetical protein FRC04_009166 [Tulasnella sp. 424]|nr:hypothetical protein FRC04_009166 [Tulasnella sp. 424]